MSWPPNSSSAPLHADAVTAVIDHEPITAALVRPLNPERLPDGLTDDLNQIGYPSQ
jgi:hypothetical protein